MMVFIIYTGKGLTDSVYYFTGKGPDDGVYYLYR